LHPWLARPPPSCSWLFAPPGHYLALFLGAIAWALGAPASPGALRPRLPCSGPEIDSLRSPGSWRSVFPPDPVRPSPDNTGLRMPLHWVSVFPNGIHLMRPSVQCTDHVLPSWCPDPASVRLPTSVNCRLPRMFCIWPKLLIPSKYVLFPLFGHLARPPPRQYEPPKGSSLLCPPGMV